MGDAIVGLGHPKQEMNKPLFRLLAEFVSFIRHSSQAKGESLLDAFAYRIAQENRANGQATVWIVSQQLTNGFCFFRLQLTV